MSNNSFIKTIRFALGGSISALAISYIVSVVLNLLSLKLSLFNRSLVGIISLIAGTFLAGKLSRFQIKSYFGFLIGFFYGWLSLLLSQMSFFQIVLKSGPASVLIVLFVSPLPLAVVSFLTLWVELKFFRKPQRLFPQ